MSSIKLNIKSVEKAVEISTPFALFQKSESFDGRYAGKLFRLDDVKKTVEIQTWLNSVKTDSSLWNPTDGGIAAIINAVFAVSIGSANKCQNLLTIIDQIDSYTTPKGNRMAELTTYVFCDLANNAGAMTLAEILAHCKKILTFAISAEKLQRQAISGNFNGIEVSENPAEYSGDY